LIKIKSLRAIAVPLGNNMITLNAVVTVILLYWTNVGHEITQQHLCHTRRSALLSGIIIANMTHTGVPSGFADD
jgi:hypothetical protein